MKQLFMNHDAPGAGMMNGLIFLIAALAFITPSVLSGSGSVWWEATLRMEVKGEYQRMAGTENRLGEYAFVVISHSSMELDPDGDYLIYPGPWRVEGLTWREAPAAPWPADQTDSADDTPIKKERIKDLSQHIRVEFRLNYLLREHEMIIMDFETMMKKTPEGPEWESLGEVALPRSELNHSIHPGDKYNRGVVEGSNVIQISEALTRPPQGRESFRWRWKRDAQTHAVTAELIIICKDR